jgi:hypothetical protein
MSNPFKNLIADIVMFIFDFVQLALLFLTFYTSFSSGLVYYLLMTLYYTSYFLRIRATAGSLLSDSTPEFSVETKTVLEIVSKTNLRSVVVSSIFWPIYPVCLVFKALVP